MSGKTQFSGMNAGMIFYYAPGKKQFLTSNHSLCYVRYN